MSLFAKSIENPYLNLFLELVWRETSMFSTPLISSKDLSATKNACFCDAETVALKLKMPACRMLIIIGFKCLNYRIWGDLLAISAFIL